MPTALQSDPCTPPAKAPDAPDTRPVEGADADGELATLAKALGPPAARVRIVRLLVRREAIRPVANRRTT